ELRIKDFLNQFISADSRQGYRAELGLQPYNEMYLHSNFENGVPAGGRIEYVKLFGLIALFILLIACINFMNLSTARSIKRAKEVGVRKTMGAFRSYLVSQFIGEAMLLTFLAMVLALVFTALALPYFNIITNKFLTLPLTSISFWYILLLLLCFTGLTAGLYPAFFLSSLNPVRILKGSLKADPRALLFRKALVVFQFVLVIAFASGMIIITRQVDFMQSKNLGFDRSNLLYVPFQGDLINKYEVFKQLLSERPGIQAVSRSTNAPSHINTHEYDLSWEGKSPDERTSIIHNGVGYEFITMMQIPLLEGRNFSKNFISDTTAFLINETALKLIGYKDPIGKPLHFRGRDGTIIGVVKDFHLNSLRDRIKPLVMFLGEHATWGYVLVKTLPGETQEAIASIESVFKQVEPEFPARYYFADDEFQKLYSGERTVRALASSFSILAVFISCLGLLGLTLFTIEQRRKEIGIRKVIGASVASIINMLSTDIVKLVMAASLVATPVAWFAMEKWLSQFAYQIDLSWWLFLVPILLTLFIALATTGFQAARAALTNPVNSLKSE
ncbi:MAG TPA: FtsX-like permease family protein, partial [Cyclobacteriaceae bacterium]|nr:FtsX-like permease family protein [Cyclobacteriaceae bacterium]